MVCLVHGLTSFADVRAFPPMQKRSSAATGLRSPQKQLATKQACLLLLLQHTLAH